MYDRRKPRGAEGRFVLQRTRNCCFYDTANTVNSLGRPTYPTRDLPMGMPILHELLPSEERAGSSIFLSRCLLSNLCIDW
jgi:hypothetical protein